MSSPNFQLPRDARIYIEQITERSVSLIQYGIWGDLHLSRLRRWMRNFTTDEERYFAACVLDSLIYRSKDQTIALIRQLFQRSLPDLTRQDPSKLGSIEDWVQLLKTPTTSGDPLIRIVALVRKTDPPTKSGYVIARYITQEWSIPGKWIITPDQIASESQKGVEVFILVDDFLGTGHLLETIVADYALGPLFSSHFVVYAPLAGHIVGLKNLLIRYPALRITPVELLDESYSLFDEKSRAFDDQTNLPETAKRFYYQLLKEKGINPEPAYGHLQLAYAFEHATPNSCLAILWWREGWQPLFENRAEP